MKCYRIHAYRSLILSLAFYIPTTVYAGNIQQYCNATDYEAIAKYLGEPVAGLVPRLIDAACSPAPQKIGSRILVAALPRDQQSHDPDFPSNDLIILVLNGNGRILASDRSDTGEDAGLRLERGSIRIDLAPYNVSDEIRLFGIDLTSGHIWHCVDGGYGAIRTLYRVNGRKIESVLPELFVTEWVFIHEPYGRCNGNEKSGDLAVVEEFNKTISISKERSNGFSDLIIRGASRLRYIPLQGKEYFRNSKRSSFEFHLHFDGRKYNTKEFKTNWGRWRS